VCALRCLLWRSLEIPLTPLALALLGGSKSVRPVVAARVSALGRIYLGGGLCELPHLTPCDEASLVD
jgi:hypothetical protein